MSEIFVRDIINKEIEQICQTRGWDVSVTTHKGYAFQIWVAELLARYDKNIDSSHIDESLSFSKDLGVDCVLLDSGQEHCYVVQAKYIGKGKHAKREDIQGFFALPDKLKEDDWIDKSSASEAAKDLLYEYTSRIRDGWKATWIFATTGKVDEHTKTSEKSREYDSLRYLIYDASELKRVYGEADSQEGSIPEEVSFKLRKGHFITYDEPRKTLVAVIKGDALINLYREHRDTLLAYNVRLFLGGRSINQGISSTAIDKPEDFFYYNNGISAICTEFSIDGNEVHAKKFQIINGGQTMVSLSSAARKQGGNIRSVYVLLRLTEGEGTSTEKGFNQSIIEYNNTQNSIKTSDFRANDKIQAHISQRFNQLGKIKALGSPIEYRPKRGGKKVKRGYKRLELEELAKIICAYNGEPHISNESPKTLWDPEKAYHAVFGEEDFWSDERFAECVLNLSFFYAIDNKVSNLIKDNRDEFLFLRKLRYHILGLAKLFVQHNDISHGICARAADFRKMFQNFWDSQLSYTSPIKEEAESAEDQKGLYNIVRSKVRWDKLRNMYNRDLIARERKYSNRGLNGSL